MRKNELFNNEKNKPFIPDEILKVTALIYLKEALQNEKYEECTELTKIAKRFGARTSEIKGVITESNRGMRVAPLNAIKKKKGGRVRFNGGT